MSKTTKKRLFFLLIVAALFLVSGCAPQTITDPETGETVTKLIYTTTTFKETFETENFFNALLVWPMAQVINYASPALGVAGAIALVTAGVHLLVTILTWKSTLSTQRMQMIQPELNKIQKKYEGKDDEASKMKMSNEMMALYKKYDINPLGSFVPLFLQMPVLIAIYHSVQRAEVVLKGSFLGMSLSVSPLDGIMKDGNFLYLVLVVVMFAAQIASMKMPNWIANYKAKKEAELHQRKYTPAPDNNSMMTMMVVILFMSVSWPSAMTVYWVISSLVSILKTLLTQVMMNNQSNKGAY